MLTIYHSPMTRSCRILWLAEELGLEYQLHTMELFSAEMSSAEYLAIHPLGKVPAIKDGDFVLWETIAIMEYLIAKYSDGNLLPARGTEPGAQAIQWMEFAENQLTVMASEVLVHDGILPPERTIPELIQRGRQALPGMIKIVEDAVTNKPYLMGEQFSAADIMMGFAIPIAMHAGFVNESTPAINSYFERLSARPAFQKAMA